jgi:hypothetical protein
MQNMIALHSYLTKSVHTAAEYELIKSDFDSLYNKYFNYQQNILDRTQMIAGLTPDQKSSLISDLEIAMMIDHPLFYEKNYDNRES